MRLGCIDWNAIRDDGITIETPSPYRDPQHFIDSLRSHVDSYELDRQAGQEHYLIICCEAAGMVPQLWDVAQEYGIRVHSSGGFDSVTAKFELAEFIWELNRPVKVLYFGDHDPSGASMFNVLRTYVKGCIEALNETRSPAGWSHPLPKFYQIAVTLEQITDMQLPWATKETSDTKATTGPTRFLSVPKKARLGGISTSTKCRPSSLKPSIRT